jgi:hypothetical protein
VACSYVIGLIDFKQYLILMRFVISWMSLCCFFTELTGIGDVLKFGIERERENKRFRVNLNFVRFGPSVVVAPCSLVEVYQPRRQPSSI